MACKTVNQDCIGSSKAIMQESEGTKELTFENPFNWKIEEVTEVEEAELVLQRLLDKPFENASLHFDVNLLGAHGKTPLILACQYFSHEIVCELLNEYKEIDVSVKSEDGYPALFYACQRRQTNALTVAALLKHKTFNYASHLIEQSTWLSIWENTDCEIRKEIEIKIENEKAAYEKQAKQFVFDALNNPESSTQNFNGRTALILACQFVPNEVENILKLDNININARTNEGYTALMAASQYCPESVEILLGQPNIDVNAQTNRGATALMFACQFQSGSVSILVDRDDLDINLQAAAGITALHVACEYQPETIPMLLRRSDIDLNIHDNQGRTPVMTASVFNTKALEALFIRLDSVDINAQDNKGLTALMLACINKPECVSLLLSHPEIDINSVSSCFDGVPALYFACLRSTPKVVTALLQHPDFDSKVAHSSGVPIDYIYAARKGKQPHHIIKDLQSISQNHYNTLEFKELLV